MSKTIQQSSCRDEVRRQAPARARSACALTLLCAGLAACGGGQLFRSYSVGGDATGFSGELRLLNNGDDALSLTQPGPFTFGKLQSWHSSYSVTVGTHPPAQWCDVSNGSGSITGNVHDVQVQCRAGALSSVARFASDPTDAAQPHGDVIQGRDGALYGISAAGGNHGAGTVYKVAADGTKSVVYSFAGGHDGARPAHGLTAGPGPQGTLYGVTLGGGANGQGVVFTLDAQGRECALHAFAAGTANGLQPSGILLRARDGSLYGVTSRGGAHGHGTMFRIDPSGRFELVHSFGVSASDLSSPGGRLVQDADGMIYGTSAAGGASGRGGIYRFDPSTRRVAVVMSADAALVGAGALEFGLVRGRDGNFYGVAPQGGAYHVGTVFRVTPWGAVQSLHDFQGAADGQQPSGALIQASDGALYGVTAAGGANSRGTVYRVSPSGRASVLTAFGARGSSERPAGRLLLGANGYLYGIASDPVASTAAPAGTLFALD